jgi:F0F1-type ATP synthase membrane subunit b/b'
MELQTTYYIIGIICMSLITLIVLGLIIVAIVIAVKVHHIQKAIKHRIQPIADVVENVSAAAKNAKRVFKK